MPTLNNSEIDHTNWGARFKADGYSLGIEVILPKRFFTFDWAAYSHAEGDEEKLAIYFHSHRITLTGRMLYRVIDGLTRHTLYLLRQQPQNEVMRWVSESAAESDGARHRVLIEKIEVAQLVEDPMTEDRRG